jgi:two-component system, chemotaxis family, protein-glutamate methylesterase/glutaminase
MKAISSALVPRPCPARPCGEGGPMIRVLVADDSPTARLLLARILGADPQIQVVGEAADGLEAVRLTQHLQPDLVTMDVDMPRMDGLEATQEIMSTQPTPIVIVTGNPRAHDVAATMAMLRLGALEVLIKPPGPESPGFAAAARRLVATVKALSQVKVIRHWREARTPLPVMAAPAVRGGERGRVVAVASSTGGPSALQCVLAGLPRDFGAPILVVQHISPGFTAGLASWLGTVCAFRVKVAEEGEPVAPRTVYLAPDDRHLGVDGRAEVALSAAPPVGGFRPSGTYLFESVARRYGAAAVAVILTGMGDDGVAGLRAVRRAGGRILAQDEKSSVIFGMPGAAVAAGLPDAVVPLDAIAPRLAALA